MFELKQSLVAFVSVLALVSIIGSSPAYAQKPVSPAPPDNRPPTFHDETLTGNGTVASPLGLADGAVTAPKLATDTPPAAGQVLTFDGGGLTWLAVPNAILPAGETTTTLLFPFVTNQAGFDTGISINNTSADTVGTPHQQGTCTISYFGTLPNGNPGPPPQTTNAVVPAGRGLTFTLSTGGSLGITGAPNFQGYIIATCNFQYAHGFALVTDGPIGQARIGSSYLALVIPEGPRNPKGEQLSH